MTRAASLSLLLLLLAAGCGGEGGADLKRPNLVRPCGGTGLLAIYDSRPRAIRIVDRDFRLARSIEDDRFSNLWGMDADDRRIVVANQRTLGFSRTPEEKRAMAVAELLFFDLEGRNTASWTWTGETGPTIDPRAVLLARDGTILVTDIRLNRVVRLSAEGHEIAHFGAYGFGPGELFYPNDLAETTSGALLVADAFNCRLQEFAASGAFVREVGRKGSGPGELLFPQHVARDAAGFWYATELGNRRISVFDPAFGFARHLALPPPPKAPQLFDLCIEPAGGRLLVADSRNGAIHVFEPDGRYVHSVTRLAEGGTR